MTISIKNRSYKIVSTQAPGAHTAAMYPTIIAFHVAQGKRGAIIAVAEFQDGSFRLV